MEQFRLRRKRCIFLLLFGAKFSVACVPSLLDSFLSAEAEKKGVAPYQYEAIFFIDKVACLICAPIIGENLQHLGAKTVLFSGLFIEATCCLLFGLLTWCPGPTEFLFVAYISRIAEGIGFACFLNSSISIVTEMFKESANEKRSILASVFTVAMIVGHRAGGVISHKVGFAFTFFAFGILIMIGGFIFLCILPSANGEEQSQRESNKILKILWLNPLCWLPMSLEFSVTVACATYESTIQPLIEQFQFPPAYSTLFLVISPAITAFFNRFSGSAIDKGSHPRKMMVLGSLMIILGYTFIGPVSFLPMSAKPYSVGLGLVILGIGISLSFVAAFGELFRVAEWEGLEVSEGTNGVVTSLWQSTFALGFIVGPLLLRNLPQSVGIKWEYILQISTSVVLLLVVVLVVNETVIQK